MEPSLKSKARAYSLFTQICTTGNSLTQLCSRTPSSASHLEPLQRGKGWIPRLQSWVPKEGVACGGKDQSAVKPVVVKVQGPHRAQLSADVKHCVQSLARRLPYHQPPYAVDLCPEVRKFKVKDYASGQDWLAVLSHSVRPNGQEKGR